MSSNQIRSDIKLIIIGDVGTGKTSLVNRWTKNIFNEAYKATIVSEFGFKIVEEQGQLYRIQLWDIGGMDQNAMVTKIFAKDAQGCVIVCDATKKKTRDDTIKWKNSVDEEVKFYDGENLPSLLIENKFDLLSDDEKKNDNLELKKFAKENGFIGFFRTSAKEGINIDDAMHFLINNITMRMEEMNNKGNNVFSIDRKNVILNKDKYIQGNVKRQKEGSCC